MKHIKINITCDCIKCNEDKANDFSLIFDSSSIRSEKGDIHGSEDMFYIWF